MEEAPCGRDAYRCFYRHAHELDRGQQAVNLLSKDLQVCSDSGWPQHYLAQIHNRFDDSRAESYYREAIQQFTNNEEFLGEGYARRALWGLLTTQHRMDEAWEQVQALQESAESSDNDEIMGRALVLKAQHLYLLSQDFHEVYRLLKEAERHLFLSPEISDVPKSDCLNLLGAVTQDLGRLRESLRYYDRLFEFQPGLSMGNMPILFARQYLRDPTEIFRRKSIKTIRNNLSKLEEGDGSWETIALSHSQLGQVLGLPEGQKHFETCRNLTYEFGSPERGSQCVAAWAAAQARYHPNAPDKALSLLAEARELAASTSDPHNRSYVEAFAIQVYWNLLEPDEALERSLTSLKTLEAFRGSQSHTETRARVFSTWSLDYQIFIGYLLRAHRQTGQRKFLETAFDVSERLRARSLQEFLRTEPGPAPDMLAQQQARILDELTARQRAFFSAQDADRADLRKQIEDLERRLDEVQHRIRKARNPEGRVEAPEFVSVDEVQAALRSNEALIAFQLALDENFYGRFAGGSWAFVITSESIDAHPIAESKVLVGNLPHFLGLFQTRDGQEAPIAARLHDILLRDSLATLPPEIDRLILLPDTNLHSVPFGALRAGDSEPVLAERFAISRIPSATLWESWRREDAPPSRRPALVLANPTPAADEAPSPTTQAEPVATRSAGSDPDVFARSGDLGPLPLALEESRALRRHLGPDILLRTGDAATEASVKTLDLSEFGILHFAAHAQADLVQPDRSSVFLAPTSEPMTDGLLQFREIVNLQLDDRVVVLSACDTAAGEILRGEGVLDLARAFFQAGSRAVVASLWPLRDDDARDFFEAFYRHLADGKSLAKALQGAQIDQIAAGAPTAAWAGIVVLGDGSLIPFPDAQDRLSLFGVTLLALGLLGLAILLTWWLARRSRST